MEEHTDLTIPSLTSARQGYWVLRYEEGGLEPGEAVQPTLEQLRALAPHYLREKLKMEYDTFLHETSGSDWLVRHDHLELMLAHLGQALGPEMAAISERAYAEFSADKDPRHWAVFLHGNREQWLIVRCELRGLSPEETAAVCRTERESHEYLAHLLKLSQERYG